MIVIYGNLLCNGTKNARKLAIDYNLECVFKNTDSDEILNELKHANPNVRDVPQIWWHGRHVGGYEEFVAEVQNTLGGYGEGIF